MTVLDFLVDDKYSFLRRCIECRAV